MPPRDDLPGEDEVPQVRSHKRRNNNKKIKVGEASGLTEEQRRALRREQRELAKTLQEGPVEEDEDFLSKVRKKNNELFENVRYTREAVLDAENLDMIAAKSAKQVDDKVQVPRYDEIRLINKLKSKCTARNAHGYSYFDWATLGTEAGVCFNALPSRVSFLVGPLENGRTITKKVRTVRQRRADDGEEEGEEERPEELNNKKQKKDVDLLSQAEKNFKVMQTTLGKKTRELLEERGALLRSMDKNGPAFQEAKRDFKQYGGDIDGVKFLMNPKSFTQTVENIFNASFLVKKGNAMLKVRKPNPLEDSNTNPLGVPKQGLVIAEGLDDYDGPSKQCVVSFTMKDWRRICEAHELEEGDLPHRKTKITRNADTQSQQSSSQEA